MIEFYLILSAVNPDLGVGMFWRLFIGTVIMLAAGYAGESQLIAPMLGFQVGMAGWIFILFEIFVMARGGVAKANEFVKQGFYKMAFIVTVGWSIYPAGYYFGYLHGAVSSPALNLIYNLADFVNKIAFCLAIWQSAKSSTLAEMK